MKLLFSFILRSGALPGITLGLCIYYIYHSKYLLFDDNLKIYLVYYFKCQGVDVYKLLQCDIDFLNNWCIENNTVTEQELSVYFSKTTCCHVSEGCHLHTHCCGNLKSHNLTFVITLFFLNIFTLFSVSVSPVCYL
jgi:hypothetical protein